jgi:Flp pilus assembly protein TadB
VTPTLLAGLALAAVCGISVAACYLALPRRLTAEEWILHRRALAAAAEPRASRPVAGGVAWRPRWLASDQYRAVADATARDLQLLRLAGQAAPATSEVMAETIGSSAAAGAAIGAFIALAIWLLEGRPGLPLLVPLVAAVGALALPALVWVRLRFRAGRVRRTIDRRLPRVLTGARVLLESGAATPEGALATAATTYQDPAGDLLREALRIKEVQRIELEAALDQVGERYGVQAFHRLGDAFRVGTRYGTPMSALIADFAGSMRAGWHAEYRERITRAPVVMTVPALVFFVLPLLVLILFLVFSPLMGTLSQL